jgi:carbon monoxide dehydrogenase subunit G
VKRVERSARIGAAPEVLFAYLSDLDNLAEWQSGVVSAERTSDGELGVGSTASVVRELMGNRIEAPLRITAYEPPRRLGIASEISGVRASGELELSPLDDGATDLRFAMEIRGSLLTAFMEPMIANAAGSEVEASLQRIAKRIEPA